MGKADLTEKNLLRYKDVFSDVANVNLFHGEKVLAEEDIVEEQTELIFKSPVDGNLGQLFLDVPMKCKKAGTDFVFICMENQSDICNIMPVRDMGYQYVKYTDQIKLWQKKNKKNNNYPSPITKVIHDNQKLKPVITLVLNYGNESWSNPICLYDLLDIPNEYKKYLEPWITNHQINVINLAEQGEEECKQYCSDFRYIVKYLACKGDKVKLDRFFHETEFKLNHPNAFLDWMSVMTHDTGYKMAKKLIKWDEEDEGGTISMCVLLDMYEERGMEKGMEHGLDVAFNILKLSRIGMTENEIAEELCVSGEVVHKFSHIYS